MKILINKLPEVYYIQKKCNYLHFKNLKFIKLHGHNIYFEINKYRLS